MKRRIFTPLPFDKKHRVNLRTRQASRNFRRLMSEFLHLLLNRHNQDIAQRSLQKQRLTPSPTDAEQMWNAISRAFDSGLSTIMSCPFARVSYLASMVTEAAKRTLNQPLEQYVEWHKRRRANSDIPHPLTAAIAARPWRFKR